MTYTYMSPRGEKRTGQTQEQMTANFAEFGGGVSIPEEPKLTMTERIQARRATQLGKAGSHSEVAVKRQARDNTVLQKIALAAGQSHWAVTDAVYAEGSRVYSVGVDKLTREGNNLDAVGPAEDNMRKVAGVIQAEKRTPLTVNVKDLRLDLKDNTLVLKRVNNDKPGVPVTSRTISDICDYFPNSFKYLKQALTHSSTASGMDTDLTIEQFNRAIVDRVGERDLTSKRKGDVLLWVRQQEAGWQTMCVTSTRNTSKDFSGEDFCLEMASLLEGEGFKGEALYDPDTSKIVLNAWLMPNHIVDLAAGDVFKTGFTAGTSDMKNGNYWAKVNAVRNLCLNLIILANESATLLSRTHNSRASSLIQELRSTIGNTNNALEEFKTNWGILRNTPIEAMFEPEEDESEEDHIKRILTEQATALKGTGAPKDARVEAVLKGYEAEPGNSLADLFNAMTRSHFMEDINEWEVARQVGELVPLMAKKSEEQGLHYDH